MVHSKRRFGAGKDIWCEVKPLLAGLAVAAVITLVLLSLCALLFALIESIAQFLILPLSLIVCAVGCYIGTYVCVSIAKRRGILSGVIIGLSLFVILWIFSLFSADFGVGINSVLKLAVLLLSGCCAGYMAINGKSARKRRR
ncbi:MAG: TIGR04086 family membrane protein [Oscillospiraceae bacterium]|jgi:putative membrane protein (TIGR04086 family)|nr:TIGR04086 family membrane protein [Oscillospiraceae bacterium]